MKLYKNKEIHLVWSYSENKEKDVDGIDTENLVILEKLKQNQRQEHLKVLFLENIEY